jgi:hypothetical protein
MEADVVLKIHMRTEPGIRLLTNEDGLTEIQIPVEFAREAFLSVLNMLAPYELVIGTKPHRNQSVRC